MLGGSSSRILVGRRNPIDYQFHSVVAQNKSASAASSCSQDCLSHPTVFWWGGAIRSITNSTLSLHKNSPRAPHPHIRRIACPTLQCSILTTTARRIPAHPENGKRRARPSRRWQCLGPTEPRHPCRRNPVAARAERSPKCQPSIRSCSRP